MAGNVQMIIDGKHRRSRAVLLAAALVILVTGCGKKSGLEHAYSYDDRAVRFTAEEGDGRASGFAAGLAVPKEGDDSPGEGEAALSAGAAGVLSLDGGTALYQQALTERMNPASTTKVMTAVVALKYGNLSDLVTVPEEAVITESGSSMAGVVPGDQMSLEDLLYGLMIPSGNDAANAIAVHVGGSIEGFVSMMNQEAARLGATGTHFVNANGLTDPDHYRCPRSYGSLYGQRRKPENGLLDRRELLYEWKGRNAGGTGGLWRKDRYYKGGRVLSYYGDQDLSLIHI